MSYGEKYSHFQSDGRVPEQENQLPDVLEEARSWEDFGKRVGEKLTQIALLQYQNTTENTAFIPKLRLVVSNHTYEPTGHIRYPSPPVDYMEEARVIANAWKSVRAEVQAMRKKLATPTNYPKA